MDTPDRRQSMPVATPNLAPGAIVRRSRKDHGLTLAQLGARTGYSAAQVSRYERGIAPLTDVAVLRRFAEALAIPPRAFGLTEQQPHPGRRHGHAISAITPYPHLPTPKVTGETRGEVGEDPVRRRQLLANLAATATAVGAPLLGRHTAQPQGEADQTKATY